MKEFPINQIICGDCLKVLKDFPENSIDSIITDPPYGLEFMGKEWDKFKKGKNIGGGTTGLNTPFGRKRALPSFYQLKKCWDKTGTSTIGLNGIPRFALLSKSNLIDYQQFSYQWAKECLRVLKPGGYLLSFGGTRTYHRMTCAIEDAGFEIRDCIMWVYGSGFPKSLNISKAIEKMKGVKPIKKKPAYGRIASKELIEKRGWHNINNALTMPPLQTSEAKQWDGWGTALKPACEPIVVARKPLSEKTIAKNVLKWGTGGINIDESRIGIENIDVHDAPKGTFAGGEQNRGSIKNYRKHQGRFPSNLILDEQAAELLDQQSGKRPGGAFPPKRGSSAFFGLGDAENRNEFVGKISDKGGASRFFKVIKPYVYSDKKYKVKGFIKDCKPQAPSNYNDGKNPSRFFYVAKASKAERNMGLEGIEGEYKSYIKNRRCKKCGHQEVSGSPCKCKNPEWEIIERENTTKNNHPTVKPVKLMEYLIKLVTPPEGIALDPFMGSGTTAIACKKLGFRYLGVEKEKDYCEIAEARIRAQSKPLL
jgi:site-specific DNA-methyltransferase (adenine-specific)